MTDVVDSCDPNVGAFFVRVLLEFGGEHEDIEREQKRTTNP